MGEHPLVRKGRRLERERICQHADDMINDWQKGNIDTKDMAVRLHLFVETIRSLEQPDERH